MARPGRDQIVFDYAPTEWAAIARAVAKVRNEPLSEIERDALRITADAYLREEGERRAGEPSASVKRRAKRKAWEKVRSKVAELTDAIENAALHEAEQRPFIVTEEMSAALHGRPPPEPKTHTALVKGRKHTLPFTVAHPVHLMSTGEMCAFLSQVEVAVDHYVTNLSSGPAYCWTFTGRLEPRVPYMQQILWLWTHRFGGKLTVSVDSTSDDTRVYGPLVDYVAAVACPIMKDAAPKPSALPDSIERQKKFYAWLSEYEDKWRKINRQFDEIGPWAYNRAVAMRERDPYGDVDPAA